MRKRHVNYWIWLQRALGAAANLTRVLTDYDGSAKTLYESRDYWRYDIHLNPGEPARLKQTPLEETNEVLELCARRNIDLVTPEDPEYPPLLRQISNYPAVLYAKGDATLLESGLPLAIVGTRDPVPAAVRAAAELAGLLSQCGFCIVSGGALGIDSAAHCGALNAGQPTVAVLGSGIGARYLQSNEVTRALIAEQGLLLSELEPEREPARGSFPKRNRILAGMTAGTVVVEAGIKSGSLTTARFAQNFDRTVMAIPFEELGSAARGSAELLDDGAPAIRRALDVILELKDSYGDAIDETRLEDPTFAPLLTAELTGRSLYHYSPLPDPELAGALQNGVVPGKRNKPRLPDAASPDAGRVYDIFGNYPLSLEQLKRKADLPAETLLRALSELELYGVLEILPDRKYYYKQDGTIHG